MLTKLLPEQVSRFWPIIKYAVEQSLPPIVGEHPDKMNRILSSALSGKVDVWASYIRDEEGAKFEGLALTKTIYDDASNTRNLLIYCIYGYKAIDKSSWLHGLESLVKYAKSKGCIQIIAYTEFPYIVETAKRLGAEVKYTFLTFNVNKTVEKINELKEVV